MSRDLRSAHSHMIIRAHDEAGCEVCASLCATLTAALATQSLDSLKPSDIASWSGRSTTVFRAHVSSLQHCLLVAYNRLANELLQQFAETLSDAPTWEIGVRDAVLATTAYLDSQPGAARLYFIEWGRSGDHEVWFQQDEVRRRFVQMLCEASGETPCNEVRFEMLTGTLHAALTRRLLTDGDFHDTEGISEDVAALVGVYDHAMA